MKTITNRITATLLIALLFLGCSNPYERDNPFDPYVNPDYLDSRDGQEYRTIRIGTQIWMAENLNYETPSGSECHNNSNANCELWGRLYNWETAMSVCPAGWYLPSDTEWQTLVDFVGGEATAGKKLKATSGWAGYSSNGTDNYGFSALPGGWGNSNGIFNQVGEASYWWSSSENNTDLAYYWNMNLHQIGSVHFISWESGGSKSTSLFSVRCVKD